MMTNDRSHGFPLFFSDWNNEPSDYLIC